MLRTRTILSAAALVVLAGCTVGPNYKAPVLRTPAAYHSKPAAGDVTPESAAAQGELAPGALARWWEVLSDPTLTSLVQRATLANHDLRLATERVREARALRRVVAAQRMPTVTVGGSAQYGQQSSTIGQGESDDGALYDARVDASWEIDVFGGVRRSVEAADADLAAAAEQRRDVLVTLVSEVARNYVEYRGFQQRIALAQRTIQTQTDTLDLTQSRSRAGIAAEIETEQARAELASRQSQLPPLRSQGRAAAHRLAVLLGQEPGALLAELEAQGAVPNPPSSVPVGVPAELIRRRPDIRRTERELAGATARIGVVMADLYPRFFLGTGLGTQSREAASLLDLSSRTWGVGPSVQWNLFSGGRIRANILAAGSRERQALLVHERTLLLALEEVENALTRFADEQSRRVHLTQAVDADRRAVELASDRYKSGIGDFLTVLVNQRQLYDAEDQLVQSDTAVSTQLVALFKSLGGGWPEDVPAGDQPDSAASRRGDPAPDVPESPSPEGEPGDPILRPLEAPPDPVIPA